MYEEFFSFRGSPFRLAPDPKFFFGSKTHNKAMAYLHYGLRQAEGFIVITGEIGAGKSILIGHLLDQLDRSNVLAANLVTPNLAPEDLLAHILSAFRIEASGAGRSAEIEAFEDFLFDQMNHGRRVLLVVDEAQNLPLKTLEELRVLSNLTYEGTPLFQVFLVGQPDFRETMARADMEQLRQRVIASYHLEPMTREETEKYIEHRLGHVGWDGDPKFTPDAYDAVHAATGGVPRKIHKLCNRTLLYCSVEQIHKADAAAVAAVLSDMAAEQSIAPVGEMRGGEEVAAAAATAPKRAPAPPPPAADEQKPIRARTVRPVRVGVERVELHAVPGLNGLNGKADAKSKSSEGAAMAKERSEANPPPVGEEPVAASSGSVFDRIRTGKKSEKKVARPKAPEPLAAAAVEPAEAPVVSREADPEPPRAATLDEVADAIAAARPERKDPDAVDDADFREVADGPAAALAGDEARGSEEAEGWKRSVVMSINDTREELKRAHESVTRLRRQLTEIDRRRRKRRVQIAASLDRAESLLTEFQNTWR